MDPQSLRDNFALVGAHGEDVAAYFYADLFERDPALRPMFPASMTKQHQMLLAALSTIMDFLDDTDRLVPYLQDLGRRHRDYGISPEHFPTVGASLLATLAYFSADAWNEDLERDWTAAYGVVADVMQGAMAGSDA
ncbi:globin family protein [Thermomonospora amylolytica]|uniref:globin family protein n=1 Tax=Thermomonospora amylolytica TaxID=1411117 RepID=UPI000E6D56BF|nr:globin family protein [Thermomonospora amylolytica]